MRAHFASLLAFAFVGPLYSCGGHAPAASDKVASPNLQSPAPVLDVATPGPSMSARSKGVPHSSNIDLVALSPDGNMALSRDKAGGLRFWPRLDGNAEPLYLPVRGALDVSLASAGKGALVSIVDAANTLHVLRVADDGTVQERFSGSPHEPHVQAIVLPGATHVLSLSLDYRISLLDEMGNVLSSVQQRRFRPSQIQVASGRVFAIEADPSALSQDVSVSMLDFNIEKKTLVRSADSRELSNVLNVVSKRFQISPDGKHVAYFGGAPAANATTGPALPSTGAHAPVARRLPAPPTAPGRLAQLQIVNLAAGTAQSVELPFDSRELFHATVAFHGTREVILSARPRGGSWRVQLGSEQGARALSSSVANDVTSSASDVAQHTRLVADGTWLFVQDLQEARHHYLGFAQFDPHFTSISPSGEYVAWSNGAVVFVEHLKGATAPARIAAAPTEAYFRGGFVGEEHLVTVDYAGGLHLINWRSGEHLASLGTGGPVRDFETNATSRVVRGSGRNGGSWVAEVGESGFSGLHINPDGGQKSGFLAGGSSFWSVSAKDRYYSYSLGELRKGRVASKSSEGVELAGKSPLAVGDDGTHYVLQSEGTGAKLLIGPAGAKHPKELRLDATPLAVTPSPDGSKLALITQGTVEVLRADDGVVLWSSAHGHRVQHLSWSKDSSQIAIAAKIGATVHSAEDGRRILADCGPWFEKRSSPPASTLSFLEQPNVCERTP